MCYIEGFIRYKNTAFSLNYSTDTSLRCCKVSRVLQLCSTAFLIIEISEFNRLIARFSSVQFSHSIMSDSLRPHELQHARPSCPSPTPSSSPKLMSIESVMPSSHLILCRPLLLLPPIPPSIRVFSSESTLCMRWPKYWSFSFSINPSNERPGLISFRMDWVDLLAVQGTLKSLLQHHSSKASILSFAKLNRYLDKVQET